MTSRSAAREDLLAALAPLGFSSGRIDLPWIWPAISEWMQQRAADVEPEGDARSFYLSRAPRDAAPTQNVFAGSAPQPIAALDLVCLEFARNFNIIDNGRSMQLGTVGVVLWYADGKPWELLSRMPGWIDAGPSTPHLDACARGDDDDDDAGWLTHWIETSPAFEVASGQAALAAEVVDSHYEKSILVLPSA
jgi:hypothetical protein